MYQAALLERTASPIDLEIALPGPIPASKAKPAFLGLDLIRFWAASLVVLYHLAFFPWALDSAAPAEEFRRQLAPVAPFAATGWVGVPIFFVLSGIVISASAAGRGWADFLRRRALRLYPTAWICGSITALVCLAGAEPHLASRWFKSMALSPTGPWIDEVFWTLGVEIVFYAYVAAVLARFGPAKLERAGLALGAASTLTLAIVFVDGAAGGAFQGDLSWLLHDDARLLLLSNGCYFGLGMTIWAISAGGADRSRLAAAAAFGLAGLLAIGEVAEGALWLATVAAIAASLRYRLFIEEKLGRWSGPIRTTGLATFPLYLLHNQIGRAAMGATAGLGAFPALGLALALVLALAFLVTRVPEPKLRAALDRALPRPGRNPSHPGESRGLGASRRDLAA
ncbi:MAG TPA: acyltransferase [Allosphingosinicella sp.]|jgi:peptidoglycan/LPS O-acetylase OafA/YrhL